jgi:hypothetical protein
MSEVLWTRREIGGRKNKSNKTTKIKQKNGAFIYMCVQSKSKSPSLPAGRTRKIAEVETYERYENRNRASEEKSTEKGRRREGVEARGGGEADVRVRARAR